MANITNALEIVCITIFLAFFTEFVNWVLVYRLPGYKKNLKLSADINDQLETLKESLSVSSPSEAKKLKRKIKEKKAQLKTVGTAMSGVRRMQFEANDRECADPVEFRLRCRQFNSARMDVITAHVEDFASWPHPTKVDRILVQIP